MDSSVLVASFHTNHEHHDRSFNLLAQQQKRTGCTAAHCLAEVYAVLTGMPGKHRASSDEAMLFLDDVRQRLSLIDLTAEELVKMLQQAAATGISGGAIYDALIAHCAAKANAEVIYTWNTKHFTRLGANVAARIRTP